MALEAEQGVIAIHPDAIVDHAQIGAAAPANGDLDLRGAGIERILDQFLHHARWPLDDFARCHLAGDVFGQKGDAGHEMRSVGSQISGVS
jgi:hypothetical protein